MSNPTIIRVPGEPGPRGPRGFPFLIKGTLSSPDELSGSYLEFDGEDEVIVEALQPGDVGYEEPVIASAFLIGESIWVFDDQELWINAGAIRPTITIDDVQVVNPDQPPNVVNTGTEADAVFEFDLPRAPTVTVGSVSVGSAAVSNSGSDGDVVLDFVLSEGAPGAAANVDVGDVTTVDPNVNPSVVNSGTTSNAVLDFELPRAAVAALGTVSEVNPDVSPSVTDSGTDGDVQLDFDLPRAPTFSVGTVTTVEDTEPASVTNVGTNGDIELDFEIPAGKVGIQFRGAWSGSESYEIRDVVTFRDASDDTESAYIALASSTNQEPPAIENSPSAFWTILASGGSDGAGAPSTASPTTVTAASQSSVIGVSEQFARADHVHLSEGFFPDDGSISDLSDVDLGTSGEGAGAQEGSVLVFDGDFWGAAFIDGGTPSSVYI